MNLHSVSIPVRQTPSKQYRVVHVIDDLKMGGSQQLVLSAIKKLEARGNDCHLIVLNRPDRSYAWEWLPSQTQYLGMRCDYRRPWQSAACARQLRKAIDVVRPEIVHSYLWLSDHLSALANYDRRFPHVAHIVDRRQWQTSSHLKDRIRRWLTRRAFQRSGTRFLAVSAAAREFAIETLQLNETRVRVAYNSIDPSRFANLSEAPAKMSAGQMILGIAARLEPEKGHEFLLHAVKDLVTRGHRVKLKITGDGTSRAMLKDLVQGLGIADSVEFVGWVKSMPDFLQGIDIFVVPSIHSEGLPTSILEAMAAGRLVVASDVGGAGEAIRNRQDGLLVPPADVKALADALDEAIRSPRDYALWTQSAQQRIHEQFTTDVMVAAFLDFYEVAMAEAPRDRKALGSRITS